MMPSMKPTLLEFIRQTLAIGLLLIITLKCLPAISQIEPVKACDITGIGSTKMTADAPVTIRSVSIGNAGMGPSLVQYCLLKVLIPPAINIWVALPMEGKWNGRLQSEGGGGYAGSVGIPTYSILGGYAGVQTDTGHEYTVADEDRVGDFGLLASGIPNSALQKDFAVRSEHLMAVVGKQLVQAFYGRPPAYSYWNGCSTGGRQGLRMAQDYPGDYDGILAGAPAIHWDRFIASEIWPQVVMKELVGHTIPAAKQALATRAAIESCDTLDGVADGVITDPRNCHYSAAGDVRITKQSCAASDEKCLTPQEASAIDRIWNGPTNSRGEQLWPGLERGAPLDALAGPSPFIIALNDARYWVIGTPNWDWRSLSLTNYEAFFTKAVQMTGGLMASANPDLSQFRAGGGKLISWHGFNDQAIMPRGTIMYYEDVVKFMGGNYHDVQQFFRLFMAPGVEHCGGGTAPQPGGHPSADWSLASQGTLFQAVVDWVEHDRAPDRVIATQTLPSGRTRTRPLCPYPALARYTGGNADDEANFSCAKN